MTLTLKQLSRLAGVHPSTVARVLNDDPRQRVSDEVRERIVALAREYQYEPNHIARSLRTKRSSVIGTLIPDIANPFFAVMFRGIEDAMHMRDISVILANTDDDPARESRGLAMLRGRQVDGVILATARRVDPAIEGLVASRFPFVMVNRHTDPIIANAVVPDDYGGAITAVQHLAQLGHKRIAHIFGSQEVSTGFMRYRGFLDGLAKFGLDADPLLIVQGSYREAGGYQAMKQLLELSDRPTAVFAVNDLAAAGALRAIHDAGLRAPSDISVIGFNDLSSVAQTVPSLTTLRLPLHDMGVMAAERLATILLGHDMTFEPAIIPVTLVCRDSTGPVKTSSRSARSSRTKLPDTRAM